MDDFLVALVAVFVILGVLMLASVYFPYYPEGVPESERLIHSFTSAGSVGFTQNYVSRSQDFGSFSVGVPTDYELKKAPAMEITAGLFGGESETFDITVPDFVVDWLKGGEITFTVAESNKLNNLVILWNGAEIYSEKAYDGEHTVEIPVSKIKKQNTLEVKTYGPGLMFWAATVYKLKDFRLVAKYGPAKFLDFVVSQDELETLDTFELTWYTASRRGKLGIEVNGEEIFRDIPERDGVLAFKDTDLKEAEIVPGNNRLVFKAYNGSFRLDDVVLNTHVSMAQKALRERVDLDDSQLSSLKARGAVLKLYIDNIDKPGIINIRINDRDAGSANAKAGWNQITLNTNYFEPGSNWIEIGSKGAFEVTEASIEMS